MHNFARLKDKLLRTFSICLASLSFAQNLLPAAAVEVIIHWTKLNCRIICSTLRIQLGITLTKATLPTKELTVDNADNPESWKRDDTDEGGVDKDDKLFQTIHDLNGETTWDVSVSSPFCHCSVLKRDQVSKLLISVPWKWRRHFLHNPEIVFYESFRIRFDWFRSSFNFSLGDPTSHLRHKWRLFTLPAHLANSDIGEVTEGYFYLIKKCRQNLNLIWTEM